MVIFGRCTLIADLLYLTILASVLKSSASSSYCIEGKQYYDSEKKQCLPCSTCNSPRVVIATCRIFSNTKCGFPTFTRGSLLEVFQETASQDIKNIKTEPQKNNAFMTTIIPETESDDPSFTVYNEKNCANQQNETQKDVRILCKSAKKNNTIKLEKVNLKEDFESALIQNKTLEEYPQNISKDPGFESETNNSFINDTSLREFLFSYFGKAIVSSLVILFNLLLIIILIVMIIKQCFKKKSKDENFIYSYNQKLPHPSQKPIKCRFTAVLPTKTPSEYANVDSYLNSLISPTFSSNSNCSNWNNSCISSTLPVYTPHENSETSRGMSSHPVNSENEPVEREPLIAANSGVVENANMIQLYSRIPSPNPFTMDRLLEHRRAIGCTSVENNLYVETWCSSTSPMLSRSQESSVAPSPALSSIRKPFSSSNSSSPLTTRTFRPTPVFTSFHPNRS